MSQNEIKAKIRFIELSSLFIKDSILATNQFIMKSKLCERDNLELKNNIQFLQKQLGLLQIYSHQLTDMLRDEYSHQLFKPIIHWDLGMIAYVAAGLSKLLEQYLECVYQYDKYKSKNYYCNLQTETDSINYLYSKLSDALTVLRRENLF